MANNTTEYNEHCGPLPPDVSSDVQLLFISVLSVVNIAGNILVCGLILANKNLREQVLKTQNKNVKSGSFLLSENKRLHDWCWSRRHLLDHYVKLL